jgi:hypothetical protein
MQRKHIVWIVIALVAFVVWRKFGDKIKSTISSAVK